MARGRKKKSEQVISPKPADVTPLANKGPSLSSLVQPAASGTVNHVLVPRTQQQIDQALGCCAVATAADCVSAKTTVASEKCDFCGEPSTGRIFVYADGLELRRGYEKDACKLHRKLNGGPMP